MRHWTLGLPLAAAIGLVLAAGCSRAVDVPALVWNIDEQDRLDVNNKSIALNNDEASVDLRQPGQYCPSGLGDVIEGPPKVEAIAFTYDIPKAGNYWLHVIWNPGGSGDEQFDVLANGTSVGNTLGAKGAGDTPDQTDTVELPQQSGENTLVLRRKSGDGLHFRRIALTSVPDLVDAPPAEPSPSPSEPGPASQSEPAVETPKAQTVNPETLFKDEASYTQSIGEPGLVLQSEHVWLFAPRTRETEANIIFPYLTKAYDALRRIVGVDTEYKIMVYHSPPGSPYARGSTRGCALWYGYPNLALEEQEEWVQSRVPHVSGYVEEMAHNFVAVTKCNFGWEMVGWSIGTKASLEVADCPALRQSLAETRRVQTETYARYKAAGNVFPSDIEPNLADRIHAYILWQCEQQYGDSFWENFFTEVRKERQRLYAAVNESGENGIDNARYRITVECFDRLPGLNFSQRLVQDGVSPYVPVQSFKPTEPGWNGRMQ